MKRIEGVMGQIRGDYQSPTVEEMLAWMRANDVPLSARMGYGFCGSHDIELEWDE